MVIVLSLRNEVVSAFSFRRIPHPHTYTHLFCVSWAKKDMHPKYNPLPLPFTKLAGKLGGSTMTFKVQILLLSQMLNSCCSWPIAEWKKAFVYRLNTFIVAMIWYGMVQHFFR